MIDAAELRRLVEAWQKHAAILRSAEEAGAALNIDYLEEEEARVLLASVLISHASELLALVEADVWRPIESAPTKGWQTYSSPEILGVDERGTQRVTQAIDTGDDEYRMGWRDPDDMEWRPTHWRPLPKEPAQ